MDLEQAPAAATAATFDTLFGRLKAIFLRLDLEFENRDWLDSQGDGSAIEPEDFTLVVEVDGRRFELPPSVFGLESLEPIVPALHRLGIARALDLVTALKQNADALYQFCSPAEPPAEKPTEVQPEPANGSVESPAPAPGSPTGASPLLNRFARGRPRGSALVGGAEPDPGAGHMSP